MVVGRLLGLTVAAVVVITIWVQLAAFTRERVSQTEVKFFQEQTRELYLPGVESREEWTAGRSLVEAENWDRENGRCGDEAETCTLTLRFPPQPIWDSELVINGTRGVLDIEQPMTGEIDAGFKCLLADVVLQEDHWITSVEPLIDTFPDPNRPGSRYDVVHHMDLFFCELGVRTTRRYNLDDSFTCSHDSFIQNSLPLNVEGRLKKFLEMAIKELHPACFFGLVYDRGGESLSLGQDLGFLIGPSTSGSREIVVQSHYLAPKHYRERYTPVWDNSAFKITLRRVKREGREEKRDPIGLLAINDYGLKYPKGRVIQHSYAVPSSDLGEALTGDFADFGNEIQPVAVHLHGHFLTKSIWVDHMRGGKKVGEYGRKDEYRADGPDQSFFFLPQGDQERPLLRGDHLRVNCLVDTRPAENDVLYGVSHDTEMCAAIFIYKNHNPLSPLNYPKSNILSLCTDLRLCLGGYPKGQEE
ncbi:Cu2 monooxygenase domain-containing protein [Chloropicon primus]|nr:Cu2 monooxygenase domain-containing protein [Chloropicon primus]